MRRWINNWLRNRQRETLAVRHRLFANLWMRRGLRTSVDPKQKKRRTGKGATLMNVSSVGNDATDVRRLRTTKSREDHHPRRREYHHRHRRPRRRRLWRLSRS